MDLHGHHPGGRESDGGGMSDDDLELLKLAAKAAGVDIMRSRLTDPLNMDMLVKSSHRNPCQAAGPWNPLTDDGDALRLAVKLEINVLPNMEATSARQPSYTKWCNEDARTDPYAATRRAIVRAAAEMGRAMP